MDACSDEPQFVHVPHLRAIDGKSLFACGATVDLEAQSVPQVVRPEESLRVRDVSEDPANLHHGQFGAHTLVRIKHICCGIAIGLELSTNVVAAERERQISNVYASLDLPLFGTSDVGRGRNRLVGG